VSERSPAAKRFLVLFELKILHLTYIHTSAYYGDVLMYVGLPAW